MKRSNLSILVVFLVLIPLTLFLGTNLQGQSHYLIGTLIILEMTVPFFMAFEGRRPQARELVVIAVMCVLAIAGRVVIPLPHFKAAFAIIILAGIAFGPEAGFVVGAVTAFASGFFYGQGPYIPWQMFAYGAGGLLAGFAFRSGRLPRSSRVMAVFGFAATLLWIGPLLDSAHVFLMLSTITKEAVIATFAAGFYVNLCQAVSTALVLLLFGSALLEKLERIKTKYGMMERENGI